MPRTPIAGTSPASRSRIANRSALLPNVDGRTATARRFRDLVLDFTDDLGGDAALSHADRALVKLAASITVKAEALSAAIVRGEAVREAEVVRLANSAARILKELGSAKRQRAVPRTSYAERLMQRIQKEQTPNG